MSEKDVIMEQWRKDILLNTLQKEGMRYDERTLDEYRPVEIQKGVIKNSEGSALAKIGKTQVLVGIKFDIATPFPDRKDEGILISNAELLPLAYNSFEAGRPGEDAIELARVVDRAVRSSEAIDLKSFYIEEDKVLGLFIDIYVLDYAGNFLDAATVAATAALTDTRMPKIEEGKIIRGEYAGALPLRAKPISTTSVKVGNYWLTDPRIEEELAMDSRITIATTEERLCAIQKGKGNINMKELDNLLDISFKRGTEIRALL